MEIVSALRSALAEKVGQERFDLWFGAGAELALARDRLVITAPNAFFQEWLRRNFREHIEQACGEILGLRLPLDFQVVAAAPAPTIDSSAAPTVIPASAALKTCAPLEAARESAPATTGRRFAKLESFVPGDSNRLALTTAGLVAGRLGAYTPVTIHGPTGVGKTHLLEGIWSAVRQTQRDATAVYLTAEQFTSYFLEALRSTGLPNFRRKYRGVDLLIIDDVQFFAGKKATLGELLYTINTLLDEKRQIVLAADRPPAELEDLGRELVTRLTGGMVCRVDPPEYEVRQGILRQLSASMDLTLPGEVIDYIAGNLTSHARELSGALNRLHAHRIAHGQAITLAVAQEALGEMIRYSGRSIRLRDIEAAICDVFGLEKETLKSGRRSKEVSYPRMLAMHLARKHTRAALSEIGNFFGKRTHSTVISAQKKVNGWMQKQETLHVAGGRCTIDEAIRRVERTLLVG